MLSIIHKSIYAMKKIKNIALFLALCMLASSLLCTACRKKETKDPYEGYPPKSDLIFENMQPGELVKLIGEGKFSTPLGELSGAASFVNFLISVPRAFDCTEVFNVDVGNILSYSDHRYGVEHIQLLDNDHLCVISKLQENGKFIYVSTLFERWEYNVNDSVYEDWLTIKNSYCYFGNVLDSSAFSSVQPGDSLDRLIEIDSAIEMFKKAHFIEQWGDYRIEAPDFNYLLTDGVMHVELDRTADPDNPTVKTITFYAYGAEDVPKNLVFLKGENRIQLS